MQARENCCETQSFKTLIKKHGFFLDSWFKYKFVNIFFWQHPTYVVSDHCNPVISLWEKSMAVNLKSVRTTIIIYVTQTRLSAEVHLQ